MLTTDAGHVLINSGAHGSTPMISRNMASLGFELEDVAVLLTMQSHFDHTAALAEIKRISGARLLASGADIRLLEDGGFSAPHFGGNTIFEPVPVGEILEHEDTFGLGGTSLRIQVHPGHTEGSASYSMTLDEGDRSYSVLIANMATVNAGKRLIHDATYRGVVEDFEETFRRKRDLDVDIWVAAHASHWRPHDKYDPAATRTAETFVDPAGYRSAVEHYETAFRRLVEAEKARL